VKLVATNAVRDLRRREADLAIRSGRPTDPNLIATRLRDTPGRLYATRAYLKRLGWPKTPADLRRADFVGFADDDRFMHGMNALGFSLAPENFPLATDNHMVLWDLVKSGLGVGVIIEEVGDAEPLVERVLPDFPPIPVPCWLVAHREVHTSRRLRVVWDLILEFLGPETKTRPAPKRRTRTGSRR
jgi:DNA-binding transcriptional LysR family regulator